MFSNNSSYASGRKRGHEGPGSAQESNASAIISSLAAMVMVATLVLTLWVGAGVLYWVISGVWGLSTIFLALIAMWARDVQENPTATLARLRPQRRLSALIIIIDALLGLALFLT